MTTAKFILLLTFCSAVHWGQVDAGGRVTSDLTCRNDEDCQIRSRSRNSYCSFASGEFRDGKPFGWCQNGGGGGGQYKNSVLLAPNPPPPAITLQQPIKIPLLPIQRPINPVPAEYNKNYYYGGENGNKQNYWDGGSLWKQTTRAPLYKPKNDESVWDYTCGSDADCQLRGFDKCSFASGEFRNGKPRGWCRPNQKIPPPTPVPTRYGHHGHHGQWKGAVANY